MAVSKTGECERFELPGFENLNWVSCQVGHNRLFMVALKNNAFRILKMDQTQKCFRVEREGGLPISEAHPPSLVNFKDEFVFLFSNNVPIVTLSLRTNGKSCL